MRTLRLDGLDRDLTPNRNGFREVTERSIGPVLIVRQDGSITSDDVLVMTNWLSKLLNDWYAVEPDDISRKGFDKFASKEQSVNRRSLTI